MNKTVLSSLISIGFLSWAALGSAQDARLQQFSIDQASKNVKRALVCRILPGEKPSNPHDLSEGELVAAISYLGMMDDPPPPPEDIPEGEPTEDEGTIFEWETYEGENTKSGSGVCTNAPIICNTLPSYNCELTKHTKCKEITLPPACDTAAATQCFTSKTGCTSGSGNCGVLTLPPACNGGITSVTGCTNVASTCALFTLPPSCKTTEKYCFTKGSTANCGTKGVICNKLTMFGTGCTAAGSPQCNLTFNAENSCALTKNWNCVNTLVQCDTKAASNCTKGYACENTIALSCLTFKGILCPNGPPRPTPLPRNDEGGTFLAMLPLLGLACFRGIREPESA